MLFSAESDAGIDLNQNAFLLIHGWTVGPLLLEFLPLLDACRSPKTLPQLAKETNACEGPLAVTLRSCSVLGFVRFHAGTYVAVEGPELNSLVSSLEALGSKLRALYELKIPFPVPSEASACCLQLWQDIKKLSVSKGLSILLQGMALSPLLTSITYNARWTAEGLDLGRDKANTLDFKLEDSARQALSQAFQELGIGVIRAGGKTAISPQGYLGLQRVYAYYVPTSYSPLLSRFHELLFKDPGWGFNELDPDEDEIHVERTLNVVGSGAQHASLFKDLLRHVHLVFDNEKFDEQPQFVVDTGCGDGHLLACIYAHVRDHTARGKVLEDHPLTMVGVDFNEKSRVATACNLDQLQVPHRVIAGDIGKPASIMNQLKRKKVNSKKCLHVRSFLDHDRPYIPAKTAIAQESVASFVQAQLEDFVHLDKEGKAIAPLELFASLVEHMARWGDALEESFGLCMLEVMQLDVATTQRFLNDCVSFHFDIVQSLSRQYMVSAVAFALSSAMAGLFPTDCRSVQTYPEKGGYCRMMNQHLVRKPYKIRLAEVSDLPSLEQLEQTWAPNLRATPEVLRKRLETCANLVCEVDGKTVAVLYIQRIQSVDMVDSQKFMAISESHDPKGRIMQLIAISSDPDAQFVGLGAELRAFALLLAKLDPSVDTVIGVTRCTEFASCKKAGRCKGLSEYVAGHVSGKHSDGTLGFHTGYGARIVRLVSDFRPEDSENDSTGVLIQYDVKNWTPLDGTEQAAAQGERSSNALDALRDILKEMQHELQEDELSKGFFMLGLDSLELVRVRTRLSQWSGRDLPATFLLDFPSVSDAAAELDRTDGKVSVPQAHGSDAMTEIKSVMADLRIPLLEEQISQGFFQLGIDSLELVKVTNRLSRWLGKPLGSTILLDYPTVRDLADELDKRRTTGYPPVAEIDTKDGPAIGKDLLIQVQEKLKEKFAAAPNQKKINALAEKQTPLSAGYRKALEPLRLEIEGSVLLSLGVIEDLQPKMVEKGRKDLEKSMKKFRKLPEVAASEQEILKLLKLSEPEAKSHA
ncbi:unnamed protein product [Effrenium voratum]|nr:unnamed protein product [Effrenium voratum]